MQTQSPHLPLGDNNQIQILMDSILPWDPQAHWQNPALQSLSKDVKVGANLISVGRMLHREEAITENAHLLGRIKSTSLGKGTHNILCLPTLVGWYDVIGKRWSFK